MSTVNLDTSPLCKLFNEYGLSLEVLGTDFLNFYKFPPESSSYSLHVQAFLHDIREMLELTSSELSYTDVVEEFHHMLIEVAKHLRYVNLDRVRLTNVQFTGIDTLILEYRA